MSRFRGVLFDWRGTLFHDEPDADWFRASAASLGRTLSDADVTTLLAGMARAEDDVLFEVAGVDAALGRAVWQRDGDPTASVPYTDTDAVLQPLRAHAVGFAVVSGIGGAVHAGITTLLLPTASGDGPRGLDLVLALVGV